jgi:hypothetical protein
LFDDIALMRKFRREAKASVHRNGAYFALDTLTDHAAEHSLTGLQ